ncbi:hypothetical protein ACQJBY_046692 [Aegilops geniculata]
MIKTQIQAALRVMLETWMMATTTMCDRRLRRRQAQADWADAWGLIPFVYCREHFSYSAAVLEGFLGRPRVWLNPDATDNRHACLDDEIMFDTAGTCSDDST